MSAKPGVTVQVGGFKGGRWTLFLLRVILLLLFALIASEWPPLTYWPMWLSAAGWIGFNIYWAAAAKNAAAAKESESSDSRKIHALLLNFGILLLFLAIPGLRQTFLPPSPAWVPAGLTLQALSIALAVWARRHLGSNWSGRIEIKTDHELVKTGPYARLRHPIYTAMMGMCIGTALVDGHVHALLGLAMVLFAYWRKIRMEEAKLRTAFGPEYEDYRRATWALVPGLF